MILGVAGITGLVGVGTVATAAELSPWSPRLMKVGVIDLPKRGEVIAVPNAADDGTAYLVPAERVLPTEIPDSKGGVTVQPGEIYTQYAEVYDPEGIAQVPVRYRAKRTTQGSVVVEQIDNLLPDTELDRCRASGWTLKGCVSAERLRADPNDRDFDSSGVTVGG